MIHTYIQKQPNPTLKSYVGQEKTVEKHTKTLHQNIRVLVFANNFILRNTEPLKLQQFGLFLQMPVLVLKNMK